MSNSKRNDVSKNVTNEIDKLQVGTIGSPAMLSGDLSRRRALVSQVEAAGIDHLFIADHISFHTGFGLDGIVNAATLAAMSDHLKIFIGVYLLALRHPVPVARQLSSLSQSAPGRITLGIGIGGEDRHEMEICGVDPARRGAHTNHSLKALRGLMTGKSTSYQCDFFEFQDAIIKPAPRPEIPLVIGGRSNAAIARAASYGEGWLGVWCSPERFRAVLDNIEIIAKRETQPDWRHGMQIWTGFAKSRKEARDHVAREMEAMYRVPFERFQKYTPFGTPEEVAEFLEGYVAHGASILNIKPCAATEEEGIEAVAEVKRLLATTC
jgi:alkanesulfonate monooxygenase SsuD/methylene tetrahydromethanopterin reductase-like flavin-dependent oxidoreductase (luciferase family)